ncbi:MAG: GDSL-type esterase/lipase family protein [Alphaproteobacteria bacterium]|nr:GDSL-type esterase/lipase family protein [Alphaproteobacteria bacterium]
MDTGKVDGRLRGDSHPPRGRWANFFLLLASITITFAIIEFSFRVATGLPVLRWEEWRQRHVVVNRLGGHAQVDPVLGWVSKPNFASPGHTSLQHGVRRNGKETEVRDGHILAVGDSFTEGWEVNDDDSWPAYLERMLRTPVVNAGVGGYGTDQTISRAEQMLPIVKPHTLIIGILDFDLARTEHTSFHAPKPWFSVDNGVLQQHPPSASKPPSDEWWRSILLGLRSPLGYSAVADFVLARLAPGYWHGTRAYEFARSDHIDGVQVTCLLLERLKPMVAKDNVRTLVFLQYFAPTILENDEPPEDVRTVAACARHQGFEVVDQFASLKALTRQDPEALRRYYWVNSDAVFYRHMNGQGNQHAAKLLKKAFADPLMAHE